MHKTHLEQLHDPFHSHPMAFACLSASSMVSAMAEGATFSPISATLSANSFLSSESITDWIWVPNILTWNRKKMSSTFLYFYFFKSVISYFTLYFSKTPNRSSSTPQFRAVWPPNVKRTPSGRSDSITLHKNKNTVTTTRSYTSFYTISTCSTYSGVIGSR